ncbi:MAG: hypothetical protein V1904_08475 [Bacteroidota bacterium]
MNPFFDFLPDKDFNIYKEFETIVKHILEKHNFSVVKNAIGDYDFDIKYMGKEGMCEVKFYQSRFTPYDSTLLAAKQLKNQQKIDYKTLLLIVNGVFPESYSTEIFNDLGVQIWDITTLFSLVIDDPNLLSRLEFILVKVYGYSVYDLNYHRRSVVRKNIISEFWKKVVKAQKIDLEKRGEKLSKQIKLVKPGNKEFHKYENSCTELLKYLFNNDLELLEKQKATDDKLSRYDLICRINSINRFWQDLSKDFNSRYIVFEFKNYKEKIKQGQIYTTEKYLFTTALRSISFLISRSGADSNAIKAAKGALKESGKLIICLADDELNEMALAKDKGDEPEKILMVKIDKFLVEINR